MNFDDENTDETPEVGSDELLADDTLRLPESASPLVRLHAVRSWLLRRIEETKLEVGEAALALQQALERQQEPGATRMRRRERQGNLAQAALQHIQQAIADAQQRLQAYEEAQSLLEESVTHTTPGERTLVEYYLALEDLTLNERLEQGAPAAAWLRAIADVQNRVERVGTPIEE